MARIIVIKKKTQPKIFLSPTATKPNEIQSRPHNSKFCPSGKDYVVNDSKLDCPYANLRIVDNGSSSPTFIHGTVITKWRLEVNPIRLYCNEVDGDRHL